jgi:nucleoside-diphosphate-sugar epimerase
LNTRKSTYKNKKTRAVIVGSGGYVSSSIKLFLKDKLKVLEISRKKINLKKKNSIKKLQKILKTDDIIIFIAAIAPCKTKKLLSDNILIVKNFNKAIKDINISYIIYISSDAVYSDTHKKINEYSKTNPKNLHGIMHLKRERMLLRKNKSKLLIIRPTLIYGPGDPHNGYGPNRFMRLAIVNKNIELFGKGEEVRDHIHIDDVGKIISMLILRRVAGILNLVTSREISFYKIAKIIINNTKSRSKIITTKRLQPMPHKGYRVFDNKLLMHYFKNYKFKLIKNIKYYE